MKIVITSDWHLDAHTLGVERFGDVEAAATRVVQHALDVKADAFFFLGDLCDPDAPNLIRCVTAAQDLAMMFDNGEGNESVWVAGNHDVLEDGRGTTVLDPLDALGDSVWVIEEPVCFELCGGKLPVVVLPYTPLSHTYDPEFELRKIAAERDAKAVKVVATHLMLQGIQAGSEESDFPRGRDLFFPVELARELFPNAVFVAGHYHFAQTYQGVHIPGSLARLTRADASNQPGFLEIDV